MTVFDAFVQSLTANPILTVLVSVGFWTLDRKQQRMIQAIDDLRQQVKAK